MAIWLQDMTVKKSKADQVIRPGQVWMKDVSAYA
jgi:hypothetical protein